MNGTSSRKEYLALESKYHNKLITHIAEWQGEEIRHIHSSGHSDIDHPIPYLNKFFAITDKFVYLFKLDDYRKSGPKNFYHNPFDYSEFLSGEFSSYYNSEISHFAKNDKNFNFDISLELYRKRGGWKKFSKNWREEKAFLKEYPDRVKESTLCPCEYAKIPLESIEFFYSSDKHPYETEDGSYITWGYCMKVTPFECNYPSQFPFGCNDPKSISEVDYRSINPYEKVFGEYTPNLLKQYEFLNTLIINPEVPNF